MEQGPAKLQYTRATIGECIGVRSKLAPLRARYLDRIQKALRMKPSSVERNACEGVLTGLDKDGCMDKACAICKDCFKCLNQYHPVVPKQALINGTWQGKIPDVLRFQCLEFPDGLNMVEMSMICLYCPLSYMTMLSSGACDRDRVGLNFNFVLM